jgi:hypothetical protein
MRLARCLLKSGLFVNVQTERAGGGIDVAPGRCAPRIIRIDQQCDVRGRRHQRMQQLQSLWPERNTDHGDGRGVAARPVEAAHEAEFDRIAGGGEDHRNLGNCGSHLLYSHVEGAREDDRHSPGDEVGRLGREAIE